jgi:hypothetical protein
MNKKKGIYDDLPHLYGPQLLDEQGKTRRVTLTIKGFNDGAVFTSEDGRKSTGFEILFVETPKMLGVTSMTNRHLLREATGTADFDRMVGKKVALYAVPSKKSKSKWAIRIAPPEGVKEP